MSYSRTDIARGFLATADKKGSKRAVKELASLLLEERMHGEADEILADIAREYAKQHGIVEAEARTAYPLSAALKKELAETVKAKTNAKKVILHEEVDNGQSGYGASPRRTREISQE